MWKGENLINKKKIEIVRFQTDYVNAYKQEKKRNIMKLQETEVKKVKELKYLEMSTSKLEWVEKGAINFMCQENAYKN